MQLAIRPGMTAGIAVLGATAIAFAPVAPPTMTAAAPALRAPSVAVLPEVDLTASVVDIFTFPAFRQYIRNQIADLAVWSAGFAEAGVGLGQSVAAIPETLVTFTQQFFSGDLQGALTTIETYLVGSAAAIGLPLLDSLITRRERVIAVQLALQSALPEAAIGLGTAIFAAVDGVLRASIQGGQDIVDAVLSLDIGNIVDTIVNVAGDFAGSFVDGGQDIINGIVFAQQTIADALATPAPVNEVADTVPLKVTDDSSLGTNTTDVDEGTGSPTTMRLLNRTEVSGGDETLDGNELSDDDQTVTDDENATDDQVVSDDLDTAPLQENADEAPVTDPAPGTVSGTPNGSAAQENPPSPTPADTASADAGADEAGAER